MTSIAHQNPSFSKKKSVEYFVKPNIKNKTWMKCQKSNLVHHQPDLIFDLVFNFIKKVILHYCSCFFIAIDRSKQVQLLLACYLVQNPSSQNDNDRNQNSFSDKYFGCDVINIFLDVIT